MSRLTKKNTAITVDNDELSLDDILEGLGEVPTRDEGSATPSPMTPTAPSSTTPPAAAPTTSRLAKRNTAIEVEGDEIALDDLLGKDAEGPTTPLSAVSSRSHKSVESPSRSPTPERTHPPANRMDKVNTAIACDNDVADIDALDAAPEIRVEYVDEDVAPMSHSQSQLSGVDMKASPTSSAPSHTYDDVEPVSPHGLRAVEDEVNRLIGAPSEDEAPEQTQPTTLQPPPPRPSSPSPTGSPSPSPREERRGSGALPPLFALPNFDTPDELFGPSPPLPPAPVAPQDVVAKLQDLAQLRAAGLLTPSEYHTAKRCVLGAAGKGADTFTEDMSPPRTHPDESPTGQGQDASTSPRVPPGSPPLDEADHSGASLPASPSHRDTTPASSTPAHAPAPLAPAVPGSVATTPRHSLASQHALQTSSPSLPKPSPSLSPSLPLQQPPPATATPSATSDPAGAHQGALDTLLAALAQSQCVLSRASAQRPSVSPSPSHPPRQPAQSPDESQCYTEVSKGSPDAVPRPALHFTDILPNESSPSLPVHRIAPPSAAPVNPTEPFYATVQHDIPPRPLNWTNMPLPGEGTGTGQVPFTSTPFPPPPPIPPATQQLLQKIHEEPPPPPPYSVATSAGGSVGGSTALSPQQRAQLLSILGKKSPSALGDLPLSDLDRAASPQPSHPLHTSFTRMASPSLSTHLPQPSFTHLPRAPPSQASVAPSNPTAAALSPSQKDQLVGLLRVALGVDGMHPAAPSPPQTYPQPSYPVHHDTHSMDSADDTSPPPTPLPSYTHQTTLLHTPQKLSPAMLPASSLEPAHLPPPPSLAINIPQAPRSCPPASTSPQHTLLQTHLTMQRAVQSPQHIPVARSPSPASLLAPSQYQAPRIPNPVWHTEGPPPPYHPSTGSESAGRWKGGGKSAGLREALQKALTGLSQVESALRVAEELHAVDPEGVVDVLTTLRPATPRVEVERSWRAMVQDLRDPLRCAGPHPPPDDDESSLPSVISSKGGGRQLRTARGPLIAAPAPPERTLLRTPPVREPRDVSPLRRHPSTLSAARDIHSMLNLAEPLCRRVLTDDELRLL